MKFKRYLSVILAFVMIICAVSCSDALDSTSEESRTVMTINGLEVPYEMYRYAAKMHLRDRVWEIMVESGKAENGKTADSLTDEDIKSVTDSLSEDERAELKKNVESDSREMLVGIYTIFTAAKEAGEEPFGEEMNDRTDMQMEEIRTPYESDEDYLSDIGRYFMNNNVYSLLTRYELVFNDLYEKYVISGKIDQSDAAVIGFMSGDGAVRAKQILISFDRHSDEEALAIAKEMKAEVDKITSADGVVDEAQFDLLTDKYGEDLYMFKNRDGYYMCRGYYDEAFEEAAFALETGHASDIVRTSTGYSVVLRSEKDPEFIKANVSKLKDSCLAGIYKSMLAGYAEEAKVETNDEYKEIDVFTIE